MVRKGADPGSIPLWVEMPKKPKMTPYDPAPPTAFIRVTPHTHVLFERLLAGSTMYRELLDELEGNYPPLRPLVRDLFAAFWRADVRWIDGRRDGSVPADAFVTQNRHILDRLLASESYGRLHPETEGHLTETALVVAAFARAFASNIDAELSEMLEAEAAYHEERRALEDERNTLAGLLERGAPKKTAGEGAEAMGKTERQAKLTEVEQELEQLRRRRATNPRLANAQVALRRHLESGAVADAMDQANDDIETFERAMNAWTDGTAELELDTEARLALFRQLMADERLRAATELLGRTRPLAYAAHREAERDAPGRVAGITLGNELTRVVPAELGYLAIPDLEREFYRRFATEELSQFVTISPAGSGRGPLVVCVDESDSMAGEPVDVAKALGLALAGIARVDGRAAALIEFSDVGRLSTTHLVSGGSHLPALVEALGRFLGGGTDFDGPLRTAYDLIETDVRLRDADVVLLTDGIAHASADTLRRIDEARSGGLARLYLILVGEGTRNVELEKRAVEVYRVADLPSEREALVERLVGAMHRRSPGSVGAGGEFPEAPSALPPTL